jgi:hypothetical protein
MPADAGISPIYVTAKDAAAILGAGTSPWTIHRLCRLGAIDSRIHNNRRLVSLASLREYASGLPVVLEDVSDLAVGGE